MILFNSDDIRQLSTHTYEANGILIIRGVSIPYTIPFELQYVNEGVRILSKLSILRKLSLLISSKLLNFMFCFFLISKSTINELGVFLFFLKLIKSK